MPADIPAALLERLHARDRALAHALIATDRSSLERRLWRAITHLGGTTTCVLVCGLLLVLGRAQRSPFIARLGADTTTIVIASHCMVQVVKRSIGRARPSRVDGLVPLAAEPDRFSFPSGHATAVMALALGLANAAPAWTPMLVTLAIVVGLSRVALGVHYVGDVVAGQMLAALASGIVHAWT